MSPPTDLPAARKDPTLPLLLDKFAQANACWFASVRQNKRAHLAPIWHVWHTNSIYVATQAKAVRVQNLHHNTAVSLALPDTSNVLIIEGFASIVQEAAPELYALFQTKYNWDVRSDTDYRIMIQIVPSKVIAWGDHGNGRWKYDATTSEWSKLSHRDDT